MDEEPKETGPASGNFDSEATLVIIELVRRYFYGISPKRLGNQGCPTFAALLFLRLGH